MPDGLTVSGGGSTAVATDELFSQATELEALAGELRHCVSALGGVDGADADAPPAAAEAGRAIRDAAQHLARAASRADELRTGLRLSADAYGFVEHSLDRLAQGLAADLGYAVGAALPGIALMLLPAIVCFGAGFSAVLGLLPAASRQAFFDAVPRLLEQHREVLSDPAMVRLVRLVVMSADDFGAGLGHVPFGLDRFFGDEGLGVLGLAVSSRVVLGIANRSGALTETPVDVAPFDATSSAVAPAGFADRAARIPEGEAQVRIERYEQAEGPDRFEVYIGGTRDFSLTTGADPWDLTSDVAGIAGEDSGAARAVRQAMSQAGIDATTPVVMTGYSQGGLIAAQLAASGEYDVRGLLTLGAPAAQVPVPTSIPYLAVEHSNDLVPALGGNWATAQPVIVSRELYGGHPVDSELAFPAHQLEIYQQTAALVDGAGDPRIAEVAQRLAEFDAGEAAESTSYLAERAEVR